MADSDTADVAVVHGAHDANAMVHLFAAEPVHDGLPKSIFRCPRTSLSSWRGNLALELHDLVGGVNGDSFALGAALGSFSFCGALLGMLLVIDHAFSEPIHEAVSSQVLCMFRSVHNVV